MASSSGTHCRRRLRSFMLPLVVTCTTASMGHAAPCMLAEQGDGHVTDIIDARSFRLADGREIKLAGVEAPPPEQRAASVRELTAVLRDRDVVLYGDDDGPDRYGRQRAFVWVAGSERSVQGE